MPRSPPSTATSTGSSTLGELLATRRAMVVLVVTSVLLRVAFVLEPFELHGLSDFHGTGLRMLHGAVPYRDFTFEYPPLAAVLLLFPGAVARGWAASAMAAQSFLVEAALVAALWRNRDTVRRYLLVSLPLIPLLSGGFDAVAMAALAASLLLSSPERASRWWLATLGALVKLFPVVRVGASRPPRAALVPLGLGAVGLCTPLLVAPVRRHLPRLRAAPGRPPGIRAGLAATHGSSCAANRPSSSFATGTSSCWAPSSWPPWCWGCSRCWPWRWSCERGGRALEHWTRWRSLMASSSACSAAARS